MSDRRTQDVSADIVTEVVGLCDLETIPGGLYQAVQDILERYYGNSEDQQ